jgi:hypothetical protein
MKYRSSSLIGLVAVCLSVSVAAAQAESRESTAATTAPDGAPNVRKGLFASAGLGFGSAKLECGLCNKDVGDGWSGYLRFGGTINPHLRLGIEANGWAKSLDESPQINFLTANLYVYPSASNNFWIQGGAGLATAKAFQNVDDIKARGAGISAGIGYDWSVSGGTFVIVPYATYLRQLTGKLEFDETVAGVSAHTGLLELGVGLGRRH